MIHIDEQNETIYVRLQPNRSATWRQTLWFVASLAVLVAVIAIAWAVIGAWVILPFAGVELALVAFFMYRVSQRTYDQQYLVLTSSDLQLTRHKQRPEIWPRKDTRVSVIQPSGALDLIRVFLSAPEKRDIEIGEFLNREDRDQLVDFFKQHLPVRRYASMPWQMDI